MLTEGELELVDNVGLNKTINTDWCNCNNCATMVLNSECVCCIEIAVIGHRILNGCITSNPRFYGICLDSEALDVALLSMSFFRANTVIRPIPSRFCVNIYALKQNITF
jgi:hypothetical protein